MKKKLSYFKVLVFFTFMPFLFNSCSKDKRNALSTPSIARISPESGQQGSVITITGSSFGTNKSKVKVSFNTTSAANIISVTDTEIKVEAPAGFSDQTVQVRVFASDAVSNGRAFYYMDTAPPSITSVTAACFYGSKVIITGSNFSPNKEDNIVRFGTIKGTVTQAAKTSLTVTTPDLGDAATADITVVKFDMVSNAKSISVDIDQNKVAVYNWLTHTVKPGISYKTGQFSLFGSITRRIHILDVTLNEANTLGIGFSTSNVTTVAMCNSYSAAAGINAGYFPMSGTVDKDPYIRINGTTVQNGHLGISQIFTNSALIIHNNVASVRRFRENHTNLNQVAAAIPIAQAQNVIVCGPMLITDGVIESQNIDSSHNTSSTARTGLGVTADGKRIFMVVVDYNGGVTGVTTTQLAKILQALGAVSAMNFDGGGSSTMFVRDQGDNGRVSINTYSQRTVRSVIYVK